MLIKNKVKDFENHKIKEKWDIKGIFFFFLTKNQKAKQILLRIGIRFSKTFLLKFLSLNILV